MESSASLTRSLSKVKSKISSKFRADISEDEHILKSMKYDDTNLPSLLSPSSGQSSSSTLPNGTLNTSTSSTSLVSFVQESRSSSVVLMESIPETVPTHQRSTSQCTSQSELQPQLITADHSLQSSRNTSTVEDNKEDLILEQLLPPILGFQSPQITTELQSPFGRLSPPMSPISLKLRNSSTVDPLDITTPINANDFADAMALSILDKVDGNASNTEWKI